MQTTYKYTKTCHSAQVIGRTTGSVDRVIGRSGEQKTIGRSGEEQPGIGKASDRVKNEPIQIFLAVQPMSR
jgi:hypothetical protein